MTSWKLILPVMARCRKKLPVLVLAIEAFDLDAQADEVVADLAAGNETGVAGRVRVAGEGAERLRPAKVNVDVGDG